MQKKKQVTSKMQKVVSERTVIGEDGKQKRVKSIRFVEQDFNFQKVWAQHLLQALDAIGNQKVKVLMWLVDNKNKENIVIATQQKIAEETECVRQTVATTMQLLVDAEAITLIQPGVYQLNPDLIFQGDSEDRASILLEYESVSLPKKEAEAKNGRSLRSKKPPHLQIVNEKKSRKRKGK